MSELKPMLEGVESLHEALIKELQALRTSLDALNENLSEPASQTTTDTRAVKESPENVKELLRLTAANQIMNLVDK